MGFGRVVWKGFVALTSAVGTLTIGFAAYTAFELMSPHLEQEVASPSGALIAREYFHPQQRFDPPYGGSISIVSSRKPWVWGYGDTVFRGRCIGDLTVSWEGDDRLWIECRGVGANATPTFADVKQQEAKLGAVDVGYRVVP